MSTLAAAGEICKNIIIIITFSNSSICSGSCSGRSNSSDSCSAFTLVN